MRQPLSRLCHQLGYRFTNEALLRQALTHCSAGESNNERLEFLGDSILNQVISTQIFQLHPKQSEGELSRLRAFLVKGDMLADIGLELSLRDYLFLGQGELKSGGHRRRSILADALEALFAAIFLDSNLSEAERVILSLYQTRLMDRPLNDNLKDPKTQLQEYLQAQKLPLAVYEVEQIIGDKHEQIFQTRCHISSLALSTLGQGETRRKAEQESALLMLQKLNP